ncbi:MAG: hypothetical protein ACJA09_000370 [Alcanivorax sp.]|jgi:hypothetical protein
MIVDASTFFPAEPGDIEAHLRTTRLLIHVASPLIKFIPYGATKLPEV